MRKVYTDAFGNEVIGDDEITLLGPSPDLRGTTADVPKFVRIKDPYGDRQRKIERSYRRQSGYGCADAVAEELARLQMERTK